MEQPAINRASTERAPERFVLERSLGEKGAVGCEITAAQDAAGPQHEDRDEEHKPALQCLAVIAETGKPVSEATRLFAPFAQTLKSVRFDGASPLDDAAVQAAIAEGEGRLGADGRVLVRASGTEPVLRIMAEGEDSSVVEGVVDDIVAVIEAHAG